MSTGLAPLSPASESPFPTTIETSRLSLSPPTELDREAIFKNWAADPLVTRFLSWPTAQSPDDLTEYLQRCDRGWIDQTEFSCLITEKASLEKIGGISIRIQSHKAEFGYVLRARSWNLGYMSELLQALIPRCFALPAIYRVSAFCDVENLASARVMEKAGLQREGLLRAWIRHPQVSPHPRGCWSYSLARNVTEQKK